MAVAGGSNPNIQDTLPPDEGGGTIFESRRSKMLGDRRGLLISTASTVIFLAIIVVVVVTAPGAKIVQKAFFDPSHLRAAIPAVAKAFLLNIKIMLIAEAVILVFALLLAVVRNLPGPVFFPLRMLAIGYIDLFRGIPLILVLFIMAFGLPGLSLKGVSTYDVVTYGIVSLVLVYSAYVAEVYRAGIESIHESQVAAARSLGLSRSKTLRYVVLPQAIRRVIPPLLNDFIGLQKDTALVSVIGPIEAAREAQNYGNQHFNFAGYVVAAVLFVLITIPMARLVDHLIARDRRRRMIGATR